MIQAFVDRWMNGGKQQFRAGFASKHPEDYKQIVTEVIRAIADTDDYEHPDVARIHEINDGDWQGTLLYVIAASGYQPSRYWTVFVAYGSCSGCDTLESIRSYDHDKPSSQQLTDYETLGLHIVQGLRELTPAP